MNVLTSVKRSSITLVTHSGSDNKALPRAIKSNSFLSIRSNKYWIVFSELWGIFFSGDMRLLIKSVSRPTLPTVMTGLAVIFLVHPARFKFEPGNSGSKNRRVLQWKISTPTSTSGVRKVSNSFGVGASLAS